MCSTARKLLLNTMAQSSLIDKKKAQQGTTKSFFFSLVCFVPLWFPAFQGRASTSNQCQVNLNSTYSLPSNFPAMACQLFEAILPLQASRVSRATVLTTSLLSCGSVILL